MFKQGLHRTRRRAALMALVAGIALPASQALSQTAPKLANILYGASYYNEYLPQDIRQGRLKKDVAMMKAAGFTVVRLGESSWGKWEPRDGKFDTAWMDEIVAEFGKAGIQVIMGTPTYSIPVWMYAKHPDMLARPIGGAATGYGMRQNMNIDDVHYRRYSQRVIAKLVSHYKNNPHVIGWQVDNETSAYGSSNPSVHKEFVQWLKGRYASLQALNEAWFLAYYDHPFFSRFPAITRNTYGNGTLLYQGTELNDDLQVALVRDELKRIGLHGPDQELPEKVSVKHATSKVGSKLHFFYNYSAQPAHVNYAYGAATELLGGKAVASGQALELQPWGVAILEEK